MYELKGGAGLHVGTSAQHGIEAFYDSSGFSNRNLFARWQYFINIGVYQETLVNFNSHSPEIIEINGALSTEVHEICHAFQDWNRWQAVTSFDIGIEESQKSFYDDYFDEAIGFGYNKEGYLALPEGHIYNDVYGGNLSGGLFTELCMLYAFEKMELPNAQYSIGYPDSRYTYDDYLTPKIRAFFDEWVFLPHP